MPGTPQPPGRAAGACPEALVALANRLADAAGAVIRQHFRQPIDIEQKADASPVTAADRGAEAAIGRLLAEERPDDGMIGEEFGARNADAAHVWVIDPIDGTRAFVTGKPTFGTLIACLQGDVPILGVIDQPIIGDRWVGAAGRPTLHNGAEARTRACPAVADARLSATSPHIFEGAEFAAFERVRTAALDTVYGSDCYAYGLLASGFLDMVIEARLKLHDFAALIPVVEGAGGVITDWQGGRLGRGSAGRVAAAGDARVHADALRRLAG
jgi:histidinol phosphatase-like enzyme (inositol monophosphatase family)